MSPRTTETPAFVQFQSSLYNLAMNLHPASPQATVTPAPKIVWDSPESLVSRNRREQQFS